MRSNKILKNLFSNIQSGGDYKGEVSNILKLILIAIVLFFIYFYYNNKNKNIVIQETTPQNTQPMQKEVIIENNYPIAERRIVNTLPILREYDYKTYHDPLTPPYKRDDYMIPAQIGRAHV